jgi:hypothetical protein
MVGICFFAGAQGLEPVQGAVEPGEVGEGLDGFLLPDID